MFARVPWQVNAFYVSEGLGGGLADSVSLRSPEPPPLRASHFSIILGTMIALVEAQRATGLSLTSPCPALTLASTPVCRYWRRARRNTPRP